MPYELQWINDKQWTKRSMHQWNHESLIIDQTPMNLKAP